MTMKTYTVTLADGTTDSRKSARPYTHAITVEYTQAYVDARIAKREQEIRADFALANSLVDEAATDAAKAEYEAAEARRAYLDELVPQTVTRQDGTVVTYDTARWLSDEFKSTDPAMRYRSAGREALDAAEAALGKTAQYRINRARANIELARKAIERDKETIVVGQCFVHGWSMSFHNAQKAADKARKDYPLCKVGVTADIQVREHGTRPKKAPAEAPDCIECVIWDRVAEGLMSQEAAEAAIKDIREDKGLQHVAGVLLADEEVR